MKLSPRQMGRLHVRALAIVAAIAHAELVVEISLREHMLLMSLVELFELPPSPRRGDEVAEIVACLPDRIATALDAPADAAALAAFVREIRGNALALGNRESQNGGVS